MQTSTILSFLLIILQLFSTCSSAGMLHLEITANQKCILKMENDLIAVRQFYPYLSNFQVIHSNFSDSNGFFELTFSLLRAENSSGIAEKVQRFRLENNGKSAETEFAFNNTAVRVHIKSSFNCSKGYFGDHCQHISKNVSSVLFTSTTTVATTSVHNSQNLGDSKIGYERVIICILLAIIVLLVAVIIFNKLSSRDSSIRKSNDTISTVGTPRYTSTPANKDQKDFLTPPPTPNTLV